MERIYTDYSSNEVWLPSAMVARLASIAKRHQKVAGSSPAVVIFGKRFIFFHLNFIELRDHKIH